MNAFIAGGRRWCGAPTSVLKTLAMKEKVMEWWLSPKADKPIEGQIGIEL